MFFKPLNIYKKQIKINGDTQNLFFDNLKAQNEFVLYCTLAVG